MQPNELYGDRTMSTHRFASRGLLAALLALSPLAVHAAPPQGVPLRDGVVVDAGRSVAYVMQPKGGIDAVDLERGTLLWHSAAGERPLALAGDLLVAQARSGEGGELRVVALDVRQRGARSTEADLPLPAGLHAEVAETLRQAFRVTASLSPQGVLLSWAAEQRPNLPRRESNEIADEGGESKAAVRAPEALQGSALFDPRAGSLLPMETADAKRLATRQGTAATLSAPTAPERLFASADGRHVLASRRVGDATSATPYRWTISDAATGAVIGAMDSAVSMAPFVVNGTRLVHVAQPGARHEGAKVIDRPLRLRAVDLATGKELWNREIRDTAFRGALPD